MEINGGDYRPLLVVVIVVLCPASVSKNFTIAESSSMQIVNPDPKVAAKDVVSSSFIVSIRVGGVDHVLSERMPAAFENYVTDLQELSLLATSRMQPFWISHAQFTTQKV